MDTKTYLYDAFGELMYLVAMADGLIQEEEIQALESVISSHAWAKEISWSFNYEARKQNNPEDIYKKVIMACHDHGPDPEYQFMIEVMEAIAAASQGINEKEQQQINRFVDDLTQRFKADVEQLMA